MDARTQDVVSTVLNGRETRQYGRWLKAFVMEDLVSIACLRQYCRTLRAPPPPPHTHTHTHTPGLQYRLTN